MNGAELKAPANAPESVTYQIDVLEEDQLTVNVQIGDNAYWTFRLRPWSEKEPAQTVDVFEDWTVPMLEGAESPTAYDGYDLYSPTSLMVLSSTRQSGSLISGQGVVAGAITNRSFIPTVMSRFRMES